MLTVGPAAYHGCSARLCSWGLCSYGPCLFILFGLLVGGPTRMVRRHQPIRLSKPLQLHQRFDCVICVDQEKCGLPSCARMRRTLQFSKLHLRQTRGRCGVLICTTIADVPLSVPFMMAGRFTSSETENLRADGGGRGVRHLHEPHGCGAAAEPHGHPL